MAVNIDINFTEFTCWFSSQKCSRVHWCPKIIHFETSVYQRPCIVHVVWNLVYKLNVSFLSGSLWKVCSYLFGFSCRLNKSTIATDRFMCCTCIMNYRSLSISIQIYIYFSYNFLIHYSKARKTLEYFFLIVICLTLYVLACKWHSSLILWSF